MTARFLYLLLLIPALTFGQVNYSSGIYKTLPWAYWDNPRTDNLVVVCQGSGEFVSDLNGTYSATGVLSKNSFAKDAITTTYPFDILVAGSYKPAGKSGNPDQSGIMLYLSEFIETLKHDKVILSGYSYGGQAATGFRTNSMNGTQPTKYIGSEIFDAYIIMCGKAPGTQDWQVNKDKPMMIIAGTNDTAVPISNGTNIMNKHNASKPKFIVQPDYKQLWGGGTSYWQKTIMSDTTHCKMVVIVGGGHSSAWTYGYQWREGNEIKKFIEWVFAPTYKPVECTATLDEKNGIATFHLPEGIDKTYRIIKVD